METRKKPFAPGLGTLLLATVLLTLIGFLLRDFRNVPYGGVGGIIWLAALLGSFVLGTVYLSRVLLPIQSKSSWTEGLRLLYRQYFSGVNAFVDQQRRPPSPSAKRKPRKPRADIPRSFLNLNAGLLPSRQAAAIMRGNTYARPGGPGFLLLEPSESLAQLFDLRPHVRRQEVEANSHDGVALKTSVSVVFSVRRPQTSARTRIESGDEPYPYDPTAIFHLNYAGSITKEDEVHRWTEQVCPQAATLLVNEIARYTLDQLLEAGAAEPLEQIRKEIRTQLNDAFQRVGIEIIGVGVGTLEMPEEVVGRRLESWQVEWQSRAARELAGADVETLRVLQQARAKAQIDIIENLLQNIDLMRNQTESELHENVMLRLIEVLEMAAANSSIQTIVPRSLITGLTGEASSQIKQALEKSKG